MHNLSTVFKFETTRVLKKPSFWAMAILIPLMLILLLAISTWAGYNGNQLADADANTDNLKVALIDDSGLISESPARKELTKDIELQKDKESAIDQVKNGETNVLYVVPKEISTSSSIEVYTNTDNNSLFSSYTNNIHGLLMSSAMVGLDQNQINVLSNQINVQTHTYIDGEETNILGKMMVPIIGLVIFYILICLFGNRLTTSTLEEKENRISEMILTSTSATTLIVGKIISLIVLGFLQVLILVVPMIVFYFVAGGMNISGVGIGEIISSIEFSPAIITYTIALLLSSYILFTGLCVLVGVLVPTAKEAGGFTGVLMMMVIAPFLFFSSFLAPEPDFMVRFLSFFPFSSPVALSMRNAFGTLTTPEAIIGLAIIIISAIIIIALAIKLFRTSGAMSYNSKINIRKALLTKNKK